MVGIPHRPHRPGKGTVSRDRGLLPVAGTPVTKAVVVTIAAVTETTAVVRRLAGMGTGVAAAARTTASGRLRAAETQATCRFDSRQRDGLTLIQP